MNNWIINKITKIDLFEVGISVTLYYILIFFLKPTLFKLGISMQLAMNGLEGGLDLKAIFYLLIGLVSMLFGYYINISKKIVKIVPKSLNIEWDFNKVPIVFVALFLISIGVKLLRILSGSYMHLASASWLVHSPFYSLVGLLDWARYIALIIAFVTYFNLMKLGDNRYKVWRYVAWGTLIFELLYAIPTCTRLAIITPLIIYLIIRSYLYGPIYRQLLIIVPLIYFIVLPIGNMCRNTNTINNFVDQDTKSVGFVGINKFVADSIVARTDQFNVFSKLIKAQKEFLYGESLTKFFISLGPPRFIWESKPVITLDYNAFGKRIGVLAEDDNTTTVGPTLPGDWYMNFGVLGIIAGMIFMGMLWRIIYLYLKQKTNFMFSGIMIYVIAWLHIIKGLEDSFAPVYAGLVKIVVVMCILHFCLTKSATLKNLVRLRFKYPQLK